MFQRMSVREFTTEPVTDEQLATILWAAYGIREDKHLTVSPINQEHAAVIYVLNEEGVYTYDSEQHQLQLYLGGDHRDEIHVLQYDAPIQLGLCWNTSIADPNQAGVELGEIGQNIQFMANALNLGTVVTGQIPPAIEPIGLPEYHEGMILMPLGHPKTPYDFVYRPLWASLLPKMQTSETTITSALTDFTIKESFDKPLTKQKIAQILWSTYGFSPLINRSDQEPIHLKRHRTVPSAHGYYPLNIYALSEDGVFRYYPNPITDVFFRFLRLTDTQVDFFGLPIMCYVKQIDDSDL